MVIKVDRNDPMRLLFIIIRSLRIMDGESVGEWGALLIVFDGQNSSVGCVLVFVRHPFDYFGLQCLSNFGDRGINYS